MTADERSTVLLETAPGHATRCVSSDYVGAFADRKAELEREGLSSQQVWAELEQLNLGRLRDVAQVDEATGLGLRVFQNKRQGFASSNQTDDGALRTLAADANTLAAFSPADEHNGLPAPAKNILAELGFGGL